MMRDGSGTSFGTMFRRPRERSTRGIPTFFETEIPGTPASFRGRVEYAISSMQYWWHIEVYLDGSVIGSDRGEFSEITEERVAYETLHRVAATLYRQWSEKHAPYELIIHGE